MTYKYFKFVNHLFVFSKIICTYYVLRFAKCLQVLF